MSAREVTGDAIGIPQGDASTLILVVDPDAHTRETYIAALTMSGWIAEGVVDGREGLAKAISYRPAAIVTEIRVPRLDGLELCRLLKSDPDTQQIPILVVTGEAEQRRIAAAEAAGADRVLIKPCLPHELARAVETSLRVVRDKPRPAVTAHAATSIRIASGRSQSKGHRRFSTTTPPSHPPDLLCPRCDRPLTYQISHVGGVSAKHSEQWDHYECPSGCGRFQYRQRTRKLRDVS